jgi:two-component system, NarL family, response regulator LiaR
MVGSMPEQLLQAIHDVHQGKSSLDPTVAVKLIRELNRSTSLPLSADPLSEWEVEILKLVAQGHTNHEIAGLPVISERTVDNHINSILSNLRKLFSLWDEHSS